LSSNVCLSKYKFVNMVQIVCRREMNAKEVGEWQEKTEKKEGREEGEKRERERRVGYGVPEIIKSKRETSASPRAFQYDNL
jgi:hypothetical protein